MSFPTSPDSFDTYGGEKSDYIAVVDPSTDRSAEEVNAAFLATAMMTNTTFHAALTFTGAATASIVPSSHRALWGSSLGVIPVLTRTGTGVVTITFPESFTDDLGNEVDVNLTRGFASLEGTTFGFTTMTKVNSNQFTLRMADTAGAASDFVGSVVHVWVS